MSQRNMVPGLCHAHMGLKDADFFAHIDANGGWPLGYRYIGFVHSEGREAGFCNSPANDGWWTVVASADDYYLWKLSPEALQRIVDATVSAIRLPRVDAQKLSIKNSRGWRAASGVKGAAMSELRFGGRCQRHPLNILPCEKCANAEHAAPSGPVDVLALLQRMVQERGSQKAVAAALDISEQYLCDVLRDRREPGEKLLDALGLERVVTYRAKGSSGVSVVDGQSFSSDQPAGQGEQK